MPLTRPKAHQLSGQSAKSSVRVVTTSNVTLSGGAPASVDGVSLTLEDRILVTAQTDATENGIYRVTTVGSGSNGTWVRGRDANQNEEVLAGMTTMVSEGTTYADTFWKLTTDGDVTLGTTELTFEQHSTVEAKSIANLSDVTLTSTSSNDVLTYNGSAWVNSTSIDLSGNIDGANINVDDTLRIAQSGSGLRMTNVGAFDNDGSDNFRIFATNSLSIGANGETGNAVYIDTSNNITINNALTATGNVTAGNLTTSGQLTATGNITGGNLVTTGTVTLDRLALTSSQTTVSPLQLTASSLNDGVGALRIDGAQADIFLNPDTATHTTVTFAVNDDQRLAFGMDDNSDFYITRRTGGAWYDDTLVIDRDSGEVNLGYDLTVAGDLDLSDGDSVFVHGDTGYKNKRYVLYGTTTDATTTEIFVGGTANSRVSVNNNTTMFYTVDIVARRTDATGESAGWQLKGVADNFSGTTADVGDVYEVAVARDDTNWEVDCLAGDTEDAVVVTVTGAASKTVKWMAVVKTMEIAN